MSDHQKTIENIPISQQHTPSLLVVGGTQRGGTSMLMRFLNTHPAINLYPYEQRSLNFYDLATYLHLIAVGKNIVIQFKMSVYLQSVGNIGLDVYPLTNLVGLFVVLGDQESSVNQYRRVTVA
jgi:hypothetical protein